MIWLCGRASREVFESLFEIRSTALTDDEERALSPGLAQVQTLFCYFFFKCCGYIQWRWWIVSSSQRGPRAGAESSWKWTHVSSSWMTQFVCSSLFRAHKFIRTTPVVGFDLTYTFSSFFSSPHSSCHFEFLRLGPVRVGWDFVFLWKWNFQLRYFIYTLCARSARRICSNIKNFAGSFFSVGKFGQNVIYSLL